MQLQLHTFNIRSRHGYDTQTADAHQRTRELVVVEVPLRGAIPMTHGGTNDTRNFLNATQICEGELKHVRADS